MLRIRAGRVHPVTAPPIEDGAVLVGDDGVIAAVGPHPLVPHPPGTVTLEYRDSVLVPGFVNTHTHLELTHLAGKNAEREFPKWIRQVRTLKEETPPEEFDGAAERGLRDCWAQGVTCVADTGDSGAAVRALARLGGRGIAYHEVFGPDPARLAASLEGLKARVHELRRFTSFHVGLGVSPHAPYTVSAPLYRAVADYALRDGLPIAVHLAESKEEEEFVRSGAGPFAAAWAARGIPVAPHNVSPVRFLDSLGVLRHGTLCIHTVQLDRDDIAVLARTRVGVAHCPLSNRAHGHGTAPLAELRKAGVPVGLGTDSVVSVGALDLWAEARAAGLAGEAALRMLTLEGARAICLDRVVGSLDVGKQGDLAVLTAYPTDRLTTVLTVVSGRIVYRAGAG
ncbi:MAG TPA: amidohydrolase family protein [Gemmatimonadales bacterium]|nr:amidohydrolase family protein [Gemmatimonadales bacterium]